MLATEGPLVWPALPPDKPTTGINPLPTDEQWQQALDGATEWLWAQSGRKYGTRVVTLRPQTRLIGAYRLGAISYLQSVYGPLWGGGWPFIGDPRYGNSLVVRRVIQLPDPAVSITSVTIVDGDGTETVLDPSTYRLDGDFLVRVDGNDWPSTQDLISNFGAPNTWQIIFERGIVPPTAGQIALAQLAIEWAKMIVGDSKCKVPWNASSVTRAGVSIQLQASLAYRTSGVPLVDRWVTEVNPNGLTSEPSVWSPDISRNGLPYAGSYIPWRA